MMPTIALVSGVRIIIYPKDHLPPHLHAILAEHEAMISIVTGDLLEGSLPRRSSRQYRSGWLRIVKRWPTSGRKFVRGVTREA
jgi:hypothetical protein